MSSSFSLFLTFVVKPKHMYRWNLSISQGLIQLHNVELNFHSCQKLRTTFLQVKYQYLFVE